MNLPLRKSWVSSVGTWHLVCSLATREFTPTWDFRTLKILLEAPAFALLGFQRNFKTIVLLVEKTIVARRPVLERHAMRDDKAGVNLADPSE
jgi:uncharacterized RDD family membrane protein YckC